jgi:hypothetical protein
MRTHRVPDVEQKGDDPDQPDHIFGPVAGGALEALAELPEVLQSVMMLLCGTDLSVDVVDGLPAGRCEKQQRPRSGNRHGAVLFT